MKRPEAARESSTLVGVSPWIALAAAFLLHAAILGPLFFHFDFAPRAAPADKEIPVEIVVEPPKPPPPPPEPAPPVPPHPPIDLKPAYDAPRTASDAKASLEGADAKTSGEKAPAPTAPQTGAPAPASEEAKEEPSAPATPAAAAKDDEGEMKASDDAPTLAPLPAAAAAAPPSESKVATLMGQPFPTWSKDKQFSTFEPVPDVKFGPAAVSPVGGGQAETTYLTIIYGLIQKHLHITETLQIEREQLRGSIAFAVDGHGDVTQLSVARPSGSNELDAAEIEAVREAAPYPTPPMGLPIGFLYNYPDRGRPH